MGVYIARQPVFDSEINLFAYELLYKTDGDNSAPNPDIPEIPQKEGLTSIVGSARAFVRFPEEFLNKGIPEAFPPDILAVEIPSDILCGAAADAAEELRSSGYTVILGDYKYSEENSALLRSADIVKIDFRTSPIIIEETAAACRESGKAILAVGVETREELEYAKRLGCTYFRGYFFAKPAEGALQPLPVNIMNAMTLMSQPDPEIPDIVETLSRDAELCRKILRLINSVYFGVTNKVSSISQAILILGLDYLREWIYLMGVRKITRNENVEMIRLSLLTAKLCRGIAEKLPEAVENADSFYLMGLLSMGVFSGKKQLAKALEEFPLSDEIKHGLLRRGGIYSDVLEMTLAYVRADWERFEALAGGYSLDGTPELYARCVREVEETRLA